MNLTLVVLSLAVRIFGELEQKNGSPEAKVAWFFANVISVAVFFLGGLGVLLFGFLIIGGVMSQEWSWGSLLGLVLSGAAIVAGHYGQKWADRLITAEGNSAKR